MKADPHTDRRIQRTKASLREALITLIEEKGFETLTVTDLTTRAGINRGTFYIHYQDKYDLLEQTEAEIIQDIETILQLAQPLSLADLQKRELPLPLTVQLFEYLKKNASLLHAVLSLKGDITFQYRITKAMERNIFTRSIFADLNQENFRVPSKYLISYLVSAHLGVIQLWLAGGCAESPQEMAETLTVLSNFGPFQALGNG
jgi:AcrR family transcriptional regulator